MTIPRSVQRDTGPLEPDSGARGPVQSLATMLSQSCNDGLPWAVSSDRRGTIYEIQERPVRAVETDAHQTAQSWNLSFAVDLPV